MPSIHTARRSEQLVGVGIGAFVALALIFGFAFEDWALIETWVLPLAIALVIYLFYRFVRAVEHFAYDS